MLQLVQVVIMILLAMVDKVNEVLVEVLDEVLVALKVKVVYK